MSSQKHKISLAVSQKTKCYALLYPLKPWCSQLLPFNYTKYASHSYISYFPIKHPNASHYIHSLMHTDNFLGVFSAECPTGEDWQSCPCEREALPGPHADILPSQLFFYASHHWEDQDAYLKMFLIKINKMYVNFHEIIYCSFSPTLDC